MQRRIIVLCLIMLGAIGIRAQVADPLLIANRSVTNESGKRATVQTADLLKKLQDFDVSPMRDAATENLRNQNIRAIYRKPTQKETAILIPSTILAESFAGFLSQTHTGIVKLNGDGRCADNTEVVSVAEGCFHYKIPGAGTSFSFRFGSYRIPRLADLILENGILKIDGIYQQGVMVNLGDVPVDEITLKSSGLKYLVDLKPALDSDELAKVEGRLGSGIKADGYVYGLGFHAKEKTTYALRSIAFKGVFMRSLNGLAYDEFRFDQRKDVVVVFRVVEKDTKGNITIVWKELSRIDAPKLKINDPVLAMAK